MEIEAPSPEKSHRRQVSMMHHYRLVHSEHQTMKDPRVPSLQGTTPPPPPLPPTPPPPPPLPPQTPPPSTTTWYPSMAESDQQRTAIDWTMAYPPHFNGTLPPPGFLPPAFYHQPGYGRRFGQPGHFGRRFFRQRPQYGRRYVFGYPPIYWPPPHPHQRVDWYAETNYYNINNNYSINNNNNYNRKNPPQRPAQNWPSNKNGNRQQFQHGRFQEVVSKRASVEKRPPSPPSHTVASKAEWEEVSGTEKTTEKHHQGYGKKGQYWQHSSYSEGMGGHPRTTAYPSRQLSLGNMTRRSSIDTPPLLKAKETNGVSDYNLQDMEMNSSGEDYALPIPQRKWNGDGHFTATKKSTWKDVKKWKMPVRMCQIHQGWKDYSNSIDSSKVPDLCKPSKCPEQVQADKQLMISKGDQLNCDASSNNEFSTSDNGENNAHRHRSPRAERNGTKGHSKKEKGKSDSKKRSKLAHRSKKHRSKTRSSGDRKKQKTGRLKKAKQTAITSQSLQDDSSTSLDVIHQSQNKKEHRAKRHQVKTTKEGCDNEMLKPQTFTELKRGADATKSSKDLATNLAKQYKFPKMPMIILTRCRSEPIPAKNGSKQKAIDGESNKVARGGKEAGETCNEQAAVRSNKATACNTLEADASNKADTTYNQEADRSNKGELAYNNQNFVQNDKAVETVHNKQEAARSYKGEEVPFNNQRFVQNDKAVETVYNKHEAARSNKGEEVAYNNQRFVQNDKAVEIVYNKQEAARNNKGEDVANNNQIFVQKDKAVETVYNTQEAARCNIADEAIYNKQEAAHNNQRVAQINKAVETAYTLQKVVLRDKTVAAAYNKEEAARNNKSIAIKYDSEKAVRNNKATAIECDKEEVARSNKAVDSEDHVGVGSTNEWESTKDYTPKELHAEITEQDDYTKLETTRCRDLHEAVAVNKEQEESMADVHSDYIEGFIEESISAEEQDLELWEDYGSVFVVVRHDSMGGTLSKDEHFNISNNFAEEVVIGISEEEVTVQQDNDEAHLENQDNSNIMDSESITTDSCKLKEACPSSTSGDIELPDKEAKISEPAVEGNYLSFDVEAGSMDITNEEGLNPDVEQFTVLAEDDGCCNAEEGSMDITNKDGLSPAVEQFIVLAEDDGCCNVEDNSKYTGDEKFGHLAEEHGMVSPEEKSSYCIEEENVMSSTEEKPCMPVTDNSVMIASNKESDSMEDDFMTTVEVNDGPALEDHQHSNENKPISMKKQNFSDISKESVGSSIEETPTLSGSSVKETPTLSGSRVEETPTFSGSSVEDTPTLGPQENKSDYRKIIHSTSIPSEKVVSSITEERLDYTEEKLSTQMTAGNSSSHKDEHLMRSSIEDGHSSTSNEQESDPIDVSNEQTKQSTGNASEDSTNTKDSKCASRLDSLSLAIMQCGIQSEDIEMEPEPDSAMCWGSNDTELDNKKNNDFHLEEQVQAEQNDNAAEDSQLSEDVFLEDQMATEGTEATGNDLTMSCAAECNDNTMSCAAECNDSTVGGDEDSEAEGSAHCSDTSNDQFSKALPNAESYCTMTGGLGTEKEVLIHFEDCELDISSAEILNEFLRFVNTDNMGHTSDKNFPGQVSDARSSLAVTIAVESSEMNNSSVQGQNLINWKIKCLESDYNWTTKNLNNKRALEAPCDPATNQKRVKQKEKPSVTRISDCPKGSLEEGKMPVETGQTGNEEHIPIPIECQEQLMNWKRKQMELWHQRFSMNNPPSTVTDLRNDKFTDSITSSAANSRKSPTMAKKDGVDISSETPCTNPNAVGVEVRQSSFGMEKVKAKLVSVPKAFGDEVVQDGRAVPQSEKEPNQDSDDDIRILKVCPATVPLRYSIPIRMQWPHLDQYGNPRYFLVAPPCSEAKHSEWFRAPQTDPEARRPVRQYFESASTHSPLLLPANQFKIVGGRLPNSPGATNSSATMHRSIVFAGPPTPKMVAPPCSAQNSVFAMAPQCRPSQMNVDGVRYISSRADAGRPLVAPVCRQPALNPHPYTRQSIQEPQNREGKILIPSPMAPARNVYVLSPSAGALVPRSKEQIQRSPTDSGQIFRGPTPPQDDGRAPVISSPVARSSPEKCGNLATPDRQSSNQRSSTELVLDLTAKAKEDQILRQLLKTNAVEAGQQIHPEAGHSQLPDNPTCPRKKNVTELTQPPTLNTQKPTAVTFPQSVNEASRPRMPNTTSYPQFPSTVRILQMPSGATRTPMPNSVRMPQVAVSAAAASSFQAPPEAACPRQLETQLQAQNSPHYMQTAGPSTSATYPRQLVKQPQVQNPVHYMQTTGPPNTGMYPQMPSAPGLSHNSIAGMCPQTPMTVTSPHRRITPEAAPALQRPIVANCGQNSAATSCPRLQMQTAATSPHRRTTPEAAPAHQRTAMASVGQNPAAISYPHLQMQTGAATHPRMMYAGTRVLHRPAVSDRISPTAPKSANPPPHMPVSDNRLPRVEDPSQYQPAGEVIVHAPVLRHPSQYPDCQAQRWSAGSNYGEYFDLRSTAQSQQYVDTRRSQGGLSPRPLQKPDVAAGYQEGYGQQAGAEWNQTGGPERPVYRRMADGSIRRLVAFNGGNAPLQNTNEHRYPAALQYVVRTQAPFEYPEKSSDSQAPSRSAGLDEGFFIMPSATNMSRTNCQVPDPGQTSIRSTHAGGVIRPPNQGKDTAAYYNHMAAQSVQRQQMWEASEARLLFANQAPYYGGTRVLLPQSVRLAHPSGAYGYAPPENCNAQEQMPPSMRNPQYQGGQPTWKAPGFPNFARNEGDANAANGERGPVLTFACKPNFANCENPSRQQQQQLPKPHQSPNTSPMQPQQQNYMNVNCGKTDTMACNTEVPTRHNSDNPERNSVQQHLPETTSQIWHPFQMAP